MYYCPIVYILPFKDIQQVVVSSIIQINDGLPPMNKTVYIGGTDHNDILEELKKFFKNDLKNIYIKVPVNMVAICNLVSINLGDQDPSSKENSLVLDIALAISDNFWNELQTNRS